MSEFEIRYIFDETLNSWIMLFTTYISIVFAFLIAATLASEKLNRVLASIVVVLFTLSAIFFIALTTIMGQQTLRYLDLVVAIGQPGPGEPVMAPVILMYSVSLIMCITYVGALFFFFYQRRRIRK